MQLMLYSRGSEITSIVCQWIRQLGSHTWNHECNAPRQKSKRNLLDWPCRNTNKFWQLFIVKIAYMCATKSNNVLTFIWTARKYWRSRILYNIYIFLIFRFFLYILTEINEIWLYIYIFNSTTLKSVWLQYVRPMHGIFRKTIYPTLFLFHILSYECRKYILRKNQ